MKYGECRGAKPLCREYEGVPHIYFLTFLARASPKLDEGKWAMGMVEKGMVKRGHSARC
jgi:hypothetical protein